MGAESPEARAVLRLVDALEDLVLNAKAVPLTSQVRIDANEANALIEQLRDAVVNLAGHVAR